MIRKSCETGFLKGFDKEEASIKEKENCISVMQTKDRKELYQCNVDKGQKKRAFLQAISYNGS